MNVNDTVDVDLTEHGLRVLRDCERQWGDIYSRFHLKGVRLEVQLWQLMYLFGSSMTMGGPTVFVDNIVRLQSEKLTKTTRRALARLATENIVASTAEPFRELVRLKYAVSLGLIPTPGAKRCTSMRAGYQITSEGERVAKMYDEDGRLREIRT